MYVIYIRRGHGVQNPNTPTRAKHRHSTHGHTPPQNQAHRGRQPASAASSEARADGHKRSSNQTHPHAPNANTAGTRFTATPPQNQAHRDRQPASAASPEARADRHKRGRNTPGKYQTPTSIRHRSWTLTLEADPYFVVCVLCAKKKRPSESNGARRKAGSALLRSNLCFNLRTLVNQVQFSQRFGHVIDRSNPDAR